MISGVVLCSMLLPNFLNAQESNLGNWLIYIGSKKIDSKWNWHHEVQYRNYNAIGDLEQLLLRTGLGYNLGNGSNLLLGYGYILSENYVGQSDEKVSVNEHRIFQQFIHKHTEGTVGFQHRFRFEERFVESDFRMRFRYFLSLNVPFKTIFKSGEKFYLSMYNEIFLNTEGDVFDRNRTYGGIGYKLSDGIKLELAYMNQFLNGFSRDQINVLMLANF